MLIANLTGFRSLMTSIKGMEKRRDVCMNAHRFPVSSQVKRKKEFRVSASGWVICTNSAQWLCKGLFWGADLAKFLACFTWNRIHFLSTFKELEKRKWQLVPSVYSNLWWRYEKRSHWRWIVKRKTHDVSGKPTHESLLMTFSDKWFWRRQRLNIHVY